MKTMTRKIVVVAAMESAQIAVAVAVLVVVAVAVAGVVAVEEVSQLSPQVYSQLLSQRNVSSPSLLR